MNCECSEKISLLLDGELNATAAREVERHLLECVECTQLRDYFLNVRHRLTEYAPRVNPARQREALAAILSRGKRAKVGPRLFEWKLGTALVGLAALLLTCLLAGLFAYRLLTPGGNAPLNARTVAPSESATSRGEMTAGQAAPVTGLKSSATSVSSAPRHPVKHSVHIASVQSLNARRSPEVTNQSSVRSADSETMTAMHFEKAELLLRAFRNVRVDEPGMSAEVSYERRQAQQLVYRNMLLRREADAAGDVQVASLLESLEPILIDIANLPDAPASEDIRVIKERVERKNIVALLQVNSAALARALD